jgi:FlaA1/EpsC-like NDP-sugar epimerase
MLKKYSQLFLSALIICDSLVILSAWMGSYYFRFHSGWIPLFNGIPPVEKYQILLLPVLILFLFNFKMVGLYQPLRGKSPWVDYYNIIKANIISVLILSALLFFYREESYSRVVVGLFWFTATFFLVASHMLVRNVLMMFRRQGKNLRYVLIAGAGELGREVAERIELHPEMGLKLAGFLTTQESKVGTLINGYPVGG